MKYIYSLFTLTSFAILAFTACQSDDATTSQESGQQVRLSFGVDGVQVTPSRAAATPTDYYTSDNLDKVAIILKQTDEGAADYAPGKPAYNYASAQWEKKDGKWGAINTSAGNVLLWKTGSATDTHEVVRFVAYAPETATATQVTTEGNYNNFSIKDNQTAATDRLASDLVLYEAKADAGSGKITVNPSTLINLEHKMCRLALTLTARNEFGDPGLQIKKVSVTGILPQANGGGTATTVYSTQDETIKADGSASRSFIIGPGKQTLTLKIEATDLSATSNANHVYTLPLDKDKTFASASQYTIQVFLGKDKVELSPDGIGITPWQEWTPANPGDDHLETD